MQVAERRRDLRIVVKGGGIARIHPFSDLRRPWVLQRAGRHGKARQQAEAHEPFNQCQLGEQQFIRQE